RSRGQRQPAGCLSADQRPTRGVHDEATEPLSHGRPTFRRRAQSNDAQRREPALRGRDPRARELRARTELMRLRAAWLLAVLALGACGGPADPAADAVDATAEPAAAERD